MNEHRISRDVMWMEMAEIAAKRGTCFRGNTGALIVHDNNILSVGYNGPPSKQPHCQGNDCPLTEEGGCSRSIHAEVNAINRVYLGEGLFPLATHMYTVSAPCLSCASVIADKKIRRVYYRNPYRVYHGVLYLMQEGIEVYRVLPSGIIINERGGKIINA